MLAKMNEKYDLKENERVEERKINTKSAGWGSMF